MKIYVSLPITGYSLDRCRERAEKVRGMIERRGHQAVTPFDACPDPSAPYPACMGRDIEALLQCDAIFLCSGWSESRGCALEWRCAQIYRKPIFQHISDLNQPLAPAQADSVAANQ